MGLSEEDIKNVDEDDVEYAFKKGTNQWLPLILLFY